MNCPKEQQQHKELIEKQKQELKVWDEMEVIEIVKVFDIPFNSSCCCYFRRFER